MWSLNSANKIYSLFIFLNGKLRKSKFCDSFYYYAKWCLIPCAGCKQFQVFFHAREECECFHGFSLLCCLTALAQFSIWFPWSISKSLRLSDSSKISWFCKRNKKQEKLNSFIKWIKFSPQEKEKLSVDPPTKFVFSFGNLFFRLWMWRAWKGMVLSCSRVNVQMDVRAYNDQLARIFKQRRHFPFPDNLLQRLTHVRSLTGNSADALLFVFCWYTIPVYNCDHVGFASKRLELFPWN